MRCLGPNCTNEIEHDSKVHRSRKYCSDTCRIAAYRQQQKKKKKPLQRKEENQSAHKPRKQKVEEAKQAELHHQRRERTHWFESQIAIDVLRYRFQQGKTMIRIATGFFTVRGYNLLRSAARGKQMYILVGLDDPGEKRVRLALIQEILQDLRSGLDLERRQAVAELVARLQGGQFQIVDARAIQHHAKLYIIDNEVVVHGSSNMTGRGLIEAIESGDVIEDRQKVADFLRDFDNYFYHPRCVNISQDLIDALLRWLQMAQPWDIYLKTLDQVKSLNETTLQRASYRKPVGYQNVVIARALRQIEEMRGAMVVASTGLGKTIMGTDIALRLHEQGEILNVMVIGPKVVKKEWRTRLASAGLSCDFFVHQTLDVSREEKDYREDVSDLEAKFAEMDQQWLIIIDESHEFRNRYKQDLFGRPTKERLSFQRLVATVKRSQCKVLLLTGTPYSTEVDNINNQLYLLPHTAPSHFLPLFEEVYGAQKAWHVNELADLRDSPVGSVITTPHVAKYYGIIQDKDIIIDFHGTRRYIPHVFLYGTYVQPVLEKEIVSALDGGYFRVQAPAHLWKICSTIERSLRIAWASSPWMVGDVLSKVLEIDEYEPYHVQFVHSLEERQLALQSLLNRILLLTYEEDAKLQWLIAILKTLYAQGKKVIIFSERLETVVYLDQALTDLLPDIHIACTVRKTQKHAKRGPQHKTFRDITHLLADFDPTMTVFEDQKYHILLTTDAFGIGVNLQTAQVVINYDLAWTPIEPAQRAGRVLRLFDTPRDVQLYTLYPKGSSDIRYGPISRRLLSRTEMLTERHEHSTLLLELPTLTTKQEHAIHMPSLAATVVVYGEVQVNAIEEEAVSSIFKHVAILESSKKEAQTIPDDIISAMTYSGKKPLLYVLLQHNEKYYWPLYDIKQKQLRTPPDISTILDYIKCTKETPLALIDPGEVEYWSDACIQAWCRSLGIKSDAVVRICAMYLKPQTEEDTLKTWLQTEET